MQHVFSSLIHLIYICPTWVNTAWGKVLLLKWCFYSMMRLGTETAWAVGKPSTSDHLVNRTGAVKHDSRTTAACEGEIKTCFAQRRTSERKGRDRGGEEGCHRRCWLGMDTPCVHEGTSGRRIKCVCWERQCSGDDTAEIKTNSYRSLRIWMTDRREALLINLHLRCSAHEV